jgi:hypothetical protein
MKKTVFFLLSLALVISASAQSMRSRSTQSGSSWQATGLTVSSNLNTYFWVYIDDVLQNERSVRSININNLPQADLYIRIVLDDAENHCFGEYVQFSNQPRSFVIDRKGSYYGWEVTTRSVRPEFTMSYVDGNYSNGYDYNNNNYNYNYNDNYGNPNYGVICMRDVDFAEALKYLSQEVYDNTRLNVAKQLAADNPLCASQIVEVCNKFSFESNRLAFAKYAYQYCTEQNKYYLVNQALKYESSKRELNEYIKNPVEENDED